MSNKMFVPISTKTHICSSVTTVLLKFVRTGIFEGPHVRLLQVGMDLVARHTATPDEPTAA